MAHALLSASGADRWLNCPPSARLQDGIEEETSDFASEGTLAHSLAEAINKYILKLVNKKQFNADLKVIKADELYDAEMMDYITDFATYVHAQYQEAKKRSKDALIFLEERIDYSNYVPEGFGTGDVIIIADGVLEIIDLKYGKGVVVDAEQNSQMMLYGLGALSAYELIYDIDTIKMTVYQPRLDNISEWEIKAEDLVKWADETLKPISELAFKGEGEFKAGNHCRWCKVKATCRARAEANLELAKHDFALPPLLADEEIADILTKTTALQKWAKEIESYALAEALKGKKWDGFKLVEGRSNRTYSDEEAVKKALLNAGKKEEEICNIKLKGITEMTQMLGKTIFEITLGKLIVKPQGKPTLVPVSDKRDELDVSTAESDFEDVNVDELLE